MGGGILRAVGSDSFSGNVGKGRGPVRSVHVHEEDDVGEIRVGSTSGGGRTGRTRSWVTCCRHRRPEGARDRSPDQLRRAGGSGEEVRYPLRGDGGAGIGGLRVGTEDQESRGIRREGASGGLPENSGGVGGSSEGHAGSGGSSQFAGVARREARFFVQDESGAVLQFGQGSGKIPEDDGRGGDEVVRSSGGYRDEEPVVVAGDARDRVRGGEGVVDARDRGEGVRIGRGGELPFEAVLGEGVGELGLGSGIEGLGAHADGVGDPGGDGSLVPGGTSGEGHRGVVVGLGVLAGGSGRGLYAVPDGAEVGEGRGLSRVLGIALEGEEPDGGDDREDRYDDDELHEGEAGEFPFRHSRGSGNLLRGTLPEIPGQAGNDGMGGGFFIGFHSGGRVKPVFTTRAFEQQPADSGALRPRGAIMVRFMLVGRF